MPASNSTIYPVNITLVQASRQNPVTISVGSGGTLYYGSTTALGATLAAGQAMTIVNPKYIQTTGNNSPVNLRTYEPWEVPAHDKDVSEYEGEVELNVMEFGAVADGAIAGTGTDNYAAFQAAIDEANTIGAGTVRIPRGSYMIGSPLVVGVTTRIIGEGRQGTNLYIAHSAGPGIRLTKEFSELSHVRIIASTAREAGASGNGTQTLNCGVLIEPTDEAAAEEAHSVKMEGVTISDHPSHGLVLCSHGAAKTFKRVQVSRCKGHGIWVDNGTIATGRVNLLDQPSGLADFADCDVAQNFGHGFVVGNDAEDYSDTTITPTSVGAPLRVTVSQLDCGDNCTQGTGAAALMSGTDAEDQIYLYGRSLAVRDSGVASSIFVMGKQITLENNRHTDSPAKCVTVENNAQFTTNGVRITDMDVVGGTPTTAVIIDSDAVGVQVDQSGTTNMGTMATTDVGEFIKDARKAVVQRPWQFKSGISTQVQGLSLGDDTVGKIVFNDTATGIAIVIGDTAAAEGGVFMFAVGTGAHCTVMAATTTANVSASSGAAAINGTGGTDGDLHVYARSGAPELYINNRLAVTGIYKVVLLGLDTADRVITDLAIVP